MGVGKFFFFKKLVTHSLKHVGLYMPYSRQNSHYKHKRTLSQIFPLDQPLCIGERAGDGIGMGKNLQRVSDRYN